MFDRYVESAVRALFFARHEVTMLGGAAIEPEHLVLGVLRVSPEAIIRFARLPITDAFRRRLADAVAAPDKITTSVEIPFSPEAKAALEGTWIEADALKNRWILPEHLILSVMVKTSGEAARALHDASVEANAIRDYLRNKPEDVGDRPPGAVSPPRVIRQWKGIVKPGLADEYIRHLREQTFPSLRAIPGFVTANILRREVEDGTEFQVVTAWRSLDAIEAFAGDDITVAVVPPAAQTLMVRYDDRAVHYDVVDQ